MLQLTDGRLMVQAGATATWRMLTPDSTGSYQNGTWSLAASMSKGRLYYASAVLKDGRVVVFGGEYVNNSSTATEDNTAEIYDPQTNTWAPVTGPGWSMIGDAASVVLPDGKVMLGSLTTKATVIWDPATGNYSDAGTKITISEEETWVLLPDGSVLTIPCTVAKSSELWRPGTGWVSAGALPVDIVQASSAEIGPAFLLGDGRVLFVGATGHTAVYTPAVAAIGTWAAGPDLPVENGTQVIAKDTPGVLLQNGHVLVTASVPGTSGWGGPASFYDIDTTVTPMTVTTVGSPTNNTFAPYDGRMLILPTGEVVYAQGSFSTIAYRTVTVPVTLPPPTITSSPAAAAPGTTITVSGTLFNGISQTAMYGDDAQQATNYPLVRVTNVASGVVTYARTFNHSSMGVNTGSTIVSTQVALPASLPLGAYRLVVVANGIASASVALQIAPACTGSGSCSDGDACTSGDTCTGGVCLGSAVTCFDDSNPCTTAVCVPATGCGQVNNTATCDDANACTSADHCAGGVCAGTAKSCDDSNVCTTDSCNPQTGACSNAPNTAACSDGDACTTGDVCQAGACKPGAPVTCNDSNSCTDDSCDKVKGCTFTNNDTNSCTDNSLCTSGDHCKAGLCVTSPVTCPDDGNVCTTAVCVPATGCGQTFNTLACDDANLCTTGDVCAAGVCAGTPKSCDDANVCTSDLCNPSTGACMSAPNTAACDDGNQCTVADTCAAGACTGGTARVCNDNNPCTDDSCSPTTGCVFTPNNANPCSDGSLCTTGDHCAQGSCVSTPVVCPDDSNVCTTASCSPATGCGQTFNTAPCDDLDLCTTNDVCGEGQCKPGTAKDCSDSNVCTTDSCEPATGACVHASNTAACDDLDGCTSTDTCANGVCKGTPLSCDDSNACTTDTCSGAGVCHHEDSCTDDGGADGGSDAGQSASDGGHSTGPLTADGGVPEVVTGGCGCTSVDPMAAWALLGVLALVGVRRRF